MGAYRQNITELFSHCLCSLHPSPFFRTLLDSYGEESLVIVPVEPGLLFAHWDFSFTACLYDTECLQILNRRLGIDSLSSGFTIRVYRVRSLKDDGYDERLMKVDSAPLASHRKYISFDWQHGGGCRLEIGFTDFHGVFWALNGSNLLGELEPPPSRIAPPVRVEEERVFQRISFVAAPQLPPVTALCEKEFRAGCSSLILAP